MPSPRSAGDPPEDGPSRSRGGRGASAPGGRVPSREDAPPPTAGRSDPGDLRTTSLPQPRGAERVRYTGVDAPELRPDPEPLAEEAAKANKRLVEGRYVRLIQGVQDRDSFGRLLRYVLADGILVEAELAREGLAEAREYQLGQPYAACLQGLQREAQAAGRGLWGL